MGKLIVFRLGEGNFQRGFPINLQISEDDVEGITHPFASISGFLPPFPHLEQQCHHWQHSYRSLASQVRLGALATQVTHIARTNSLQICQQQAEKLRSSLASWYHSEVEAFSRVREKILSELHKTEQVRLLVQTEQKNLRLLPWHLFFESLLETYPYAEVALSPINYGYTHFVNSDRSSIRILAILGSSEGIDIQTDQQIIANLAHAEVKFLVSPSREELNECLWQQGWDILFFAGHSYSQGDTLKGQFQINAIDSLSISELKHSLSKAIRHGLRLAIFNSCDGLALAQELEELHLSQVIVMREMVPDQVAQTFLKQFLTAFAQGESLYLAVRQGREKLQPLEKQYPCATWLPLICQNPATLPLTWQSLHNIEFSPTIEPYAAVSPIIPNLEQTVLHRNIGNTTLAIEYNDLSQVSAEVLVNFDDIYLSLSGNVASALLQRGGKVIKEEAQRRLPKKLGQVAMTTGGNLTAQQIFHGVVIDYEHPELTNISLIQQVTRRCLELADLSEVRSLAFPALVTDILPLSSEQWAIAMMLEIVHYLGHNSQLEKIIIALSRDKYRQQEQIKRFYTQVANFLDMQLSMETRQELLEDLESIYHQRKMESAAKIVSRYQEKLVNLQEKWTQDMLGLDLSNFVHSPAPFSYALPDVTEIANTNIELNAPTPENKEQQLIELHQSFNAIAANIWEQLQMTEEEEEIITLINSLQGNIDAIAWLNDQYELAIVAQEAKVKKVKEILESQLNQLKQGQNTLQQQLLSWYDQGDLDKTTTGEERKISFQSYPKLELLVKPEELPPEYRNKKISYTPKKKELKDACSQGIDISKWGKIASNIKVKFGWHNKPR